MLAVAFVVFVPPAKACGCQSPKGIDDLRWPSIVFKGRVMSVAFREGKGSYFKENGELVLDVSSERVLFEVIEQYRGPTKRRISIKFNEGGTTSCDLRKLDFKKGDVFLLSTDFDKDTESAAAHGRWYDNSYCDLRERLSPKHGSDSK
jgi:hypothetical protein